MLSLMKDLWMDQSISVRWILTGGAAISMLAYASEWHYISTAEAMEIDREQSELIEQQSKKIEENGRKFDKFVRRYNVDKIETEIKAVQADKHSLSLFISANGETVLTKQIEEELDSDMLSLRAKLACVTAGNEEC